MKAALTAHLGSYNQVSPRGYSCRIACNTDMLLVIQGTADADVSSRHTQKEVASSVNFALNTFKRDTPEQQKAVLDKVQHAGHEPEELEKLTEDELNVLNNIVGRQLRLTKTEKDLENFANDVIDGLTPDLKRGSLGLRKSETTIGSKNSEMADLFDLNRSL